MVFRVAFAQPVHGAVPDVADLGLGQAGLAALLRLLCIAFPLALIIRGNALALTFILVVAVFPSINAEVPAFDRLARIHAVAHALLRRVDAFAAAVIVAGAILRHTLVATLLGVHLVAGPVALLAHLNAVAIAFDVVAIFCSNTHVAAFLGLPLTADTPTRLLAGDALAIAIVKLLAVHFDADVAALSRPMFAGADPLAGLAGGDALPLAVDKVLPVAGQAVLAAADRPGRVALAPARLADVQAEAVASVVAGLGSTATLAEDLVGPALAVARQLLGLALVAAHHHLVLVGAELGVVEAFAELSVPVAFSLVYIFF